MNDNKVLTLALRNLPFVIMTFFVCCGSVISSIPTNVDNDYREDLEIQKIENSLRNQKLKLNNYKISLKTIQQDLEENNSTFLSNLEKIKVLDSHLIGLKDDLNSSYDNLGIINKRIKKTINYFIILSLDSNGEVDELINNKIIITNLKESMNDLKSQIDTIRELKLRVGSVQESLGKLKLLDSELSDILNRLEDKKRKFVRTPLIPKKQNLLAKVNSIVDPKVDLKSDPKVDSKILKKFMIPIAKYEKIQFGKKGVNFKFKGVGPILAGEKGIIIYSGTLSNFGNVIVIDHGDSTRSVILGSFRAKINKNDIVERGDILGYTIDNEVEEGNLYFEIRREDVVQNSIEWLDTKNKNSNL